MWPFKTRSDESMLGKRGEKIAKRHFKARGLKILATNYRCPVGEADLVALDCSSGRDRATLVFAEVKTRSSDKYTDPHSAVDAPKRRRIRKVAEYYVNTHDAAEMTVRFDVVAIVMAPGRKPRITYIPDAF